MKLGQSIDHLGMFTNIVEGMLGTIVGTLITHKDDPFLFRSRNGPHFLLQQGQACFHALQN